jgi:hypothetical protein
MADTFEDCSEAMCTMSYQEQVTEKWTYTSSKLSNNFYWTPSKLKFTDISYYPDLTYIVADFQSYSGAVDYQICPVTLKNASGGIMGTANMVQSKDGAIAKLWLININNWNIGSLTGTQVVTIENYTLSFQVFSSSNWGGAGYNNRTLFGYVEGSTFYTVYDDGSTPYETRYIKGWKHGRWAKKLEDHQYQIILNRTIEGQQYNSYAEIKTDEHVYYTGTATGTNIITYVYEVPIYLNVKDIYGHWYNYTYTDEAIAVNRLYGVIREAKDNYVVPGVNVTLGTDTIVTNDQGFYQIYKEASGTFFFQLNKPGYQTRTFYIDYEPPMSFNTWIAKNETVNTGTATVYGFVYDNETREPLENAFVRVFNTTYNTYVYTGEGGYFVFYDLTNTSYSLSAEYPGYYKQLKELTLPNLDTSYYYEFWLTNTSYTPPGAEGPTPPPTIRPNIFRENIENIFNTFGFDEETGNYLLGLLVIGAMAGFFSWATKFKSPILTGVGAFFGFIICIGTSLFPRWMLGLTIFVVVGACAAILIKVGR